MNPTPPVLQNKAEHHSPLPATTILSVNNKCPNIINNATPSRQFIKHVSKIEGNDLHNLGITRLPKLEQV